MFLTLVTRVWATDVLTTLPWTSVPTTKSPPMTGRPRYVRWKGTYMRPSDVSTLPAWNRSWRLALKVSGLEATKRSALRAASARASAEGRDPKDVDPGRESDACATAPVGASAVSAETRAMVAPPMTSLFTVSLSCWCG